MVCFSFLVFYLCLCLSVLVPPVPPWAAVSLPWSDLLLRLSMELSTELMLFISIWLIFFFGVSTFPWFFMFPMLLLWDLHSWGYFVALKKSTIYFQLEYLQCSSGTYMCTVEGHSAENNFIINCENDNALWIGPWCKCPGRELTTLCPLTSGMVGGKTTKDRMECLDFSW